MIKFSLFGLLLLFLVVLETQCAKNTHDQPTHDGNGNKIDRLQVSVRRVRATQNDHKAVDGSNTIDPPDFWCQKCTSTNETECDVQPRVGCMSRQCYTYNATEGYINKGCGSCDINYGNTCRRCKTSMCNNLNSGSQSVYLTGVLAVVSLVMVYRFI